MYGYQRQYWPSYGYPRLSQATPPPAPQAPLPSQKASAPTVLAVASAGGAVAGLLLSFILPALDKRIPMDAGKRVAGMIGGAFGGALGAGTALILKD